MTIKKILEGFDTHLAYHSMNFGPGDIGKNKPRTVHYNSGAIKDKLQGETESFVKSKKKKKKKNKILEMTTSASVGNVLPIGFMGRIVRRFTDKQAKDDILGLLKMVGKTR